MSLYIIAYGVSFAGAGGPGPRQQPGDQLRPGTGGTGVSLVRPAVPHPHDGAQLPGCCRCQAACGFWVRRRQLVGSLAAKGSFRMDEESLGPSACRSAILSRLLRSCPHSHLCATVVCRACCWATPAPGWLWGCPLSWMSFPLVRLPAGGRPALSFSADWHSAPLPATQSRLPACWPTMALQPLPGCPPTFAHQPSPACLPTFAVPCSACLPAGRDKVEFLLAMGATRMEATREVVQRASRMALTPLLNTVGQAAEVVVGCCRCCRCCRRCRRCSCCRCCCRRCRRCSCCRCCRRCCRSRCCCCCCMAPRSRS